MKRLVIVGLALVSLLSASGCFLAPAIDSFKQLGMTEQDRIGLLPVSVKKFSDALYWGKSDDALQYVLKESRPVLGPQLRDSVRSEKIVEAKLTGSDFNDGAWEANIEVSVKAYQVPFYVVRERREQQVWKFGLHEGWQLVSHTVVPDATRGAAARPMPRFLEGPPS